MANQFDLFLFFFLVIAVDDALFFSLVFTHTMVQQWLRKFYGFTERFRGK